MKHFELNIDKLLESWDLSHAVRELIANAIDESVLTNTPPPEVTKDESGCWRIRDYGRGLRYQDLIQGENPEKLANPAIIGKFGIGLKDALATFDRKAVRVLLCSRHGDISLTGVTKHPFDDFVTLHAKVSPASFPDLLGTECRLHGVSDADVAAAKLMFLRFADSTLMEDTKFGSVHDRPPAGGVIYINGMSVAEEPNFLFSYNITRPNAALKPALNRERQNLGGTAYTESICSILLACQSEGVVQTLSADLMAYSSGLAHAELAWLEVQEHAVRILSASKRVLFISPEELVARPDLVEAAQATGFQIVAVPENLTKKIAGLTDISGKPVTELRQFIKQHNESFKFSWVLSEDPTYAERSWWSHVTRRLGRSIMRRRYKVAIAAAAIAAGLAYYLYGPTPRTGSRPQLPSATPVSIDISVHGQPLTTITNAAGLASVMEMLRSGRSVKAHMLRNRGVMVLHFSDGESLRVSFLPGLHLLRYEFGAPGGLFTVSRSRFMGALRAADVDVQKIPTR